MSLLKQDHQEGAGAQEQYYVQERNAARVREKGIRVSLVFNGVRSRQVAGDLSPWRRERRGACIGSLTIGSLTPMKTEQHLIPTSLSFDTFDS